MGSDVDLITTCVRPVCDSAAGDIDVDRIAACVRPVCESAANSRSRSLSFTPAVNASEQISRGFGFRGALVAS